MAVDAEEKVYYTFSMSDTPRTDAECGWYDPNGVRYPDPTGDHVDPDFARDLERELNAAKARVARLEEAGDKMANVLICSAAVKHKTSATASAWRKAKEAKP